MNRDKTTFNGTRKKRKIRQEIAKVKSICDGFRLLNKKLKLRSEGDTL